MVYHRPFQQHLLHFRLSASIRSLLITLFPLSAGCQIKVASPTPFQHLSWSSLLIWLLHCWRSYTVDAFQQPLCRNCSSPRSSRHCSTSQTSTPPIHGLTDRFPSYRLCVSFSCVSFSAAVLQLPLCGRYSVCLSDTSFYRDGDGRAVDDGDLSVLALLDMSATFDTVDHDILLTQLRVSFGIRGAALDWFQCGLACHRGFVPGPMLLISYTAGLIEVICMPTTRKYRALVVLDLPTSSSPPCQLAWTKWLTGCCQIAYSWTLWRQRSSDVWPHVGRTICCCSFRSEPRAACNNCSWPGNPHRQRCRYAVSCVPYGVAMFCCVTTAAQHQTFSVRFCVPFAGRVAGYTTSRLRQRNTRMTSCVPAPSTSVGAQRRRQTDTSIFSVWARHTDAARPSLAAVSRNASISSWLCSFTDACTAWRHGIFPTTSSASPIPTAVVSGRRHPRS